jgi:hypothetical protein
MKIEEVVKINKITKTVMEDEEGSAENFKTLMLPTDEEENFSFTLSTEHKPELDIGDVVKITIAPEQRKITESIKENKK